MRQDLTIFLRSVGKVVVKLEKSNNKKEIDMKALKIVMYVVVAYLTIIGSLYLFFPDTAENAFGIALSDRSTAMLHGFGNPVMAFLIYTTAANLENYR